jgi:hypothetical protein
MCASTSEIMLAILLPAGRAKSRSGLIGARSGKLVLMGARSNRSATARMLRELRRREMLGESNVGLAALAETSARELDAAIARGEKGYALDRLMRCHLAIMRELVSIPTPMSPDAFDEFVKELSVPGPGGLDGGGVSGFDEMFGPPRV